MGEYGTPDYMETFPWSGETWYELGKGGGELVRRASITVSESSSNSD